MECEGIFSKDSDQNNQVEMAFLLFMLEEMPSHREGTSVEIK